MLACFTEVAEQLGDMLVGKPKSGVLLVGVFLF